MKRRLGTFAAVVAMFAMIFDSRTALTGSIAGVQLCVATAIPALFPFLVISGALVKTIGNAKLPAFSLLKLPHQATALVIVGFLGGYPVGARCIAQEVKNGNLSASDGERMLAFCSNAGPAFLFGIGASLFPNIWYCWLLWAIHILSALIVGFLTPRSALSSPILSRPSKSAANGMIDAVKSMGLICGWIVIFRVVISFCQRWFLWLLPGNYQLLVEGLLEISNGCCDLKDISNIGLRMQLFSIFLGFGGMCVLLQTRSILLDSGLRGQYYFPGKITQASISYLLSVALQFFLPEQAQYYPTFYFPLGALSIVLFYVFLHRKTQKSGRNLPAYDI